MQVCVRFHSSSSMCKCVFTSILVHVVHVCVRFHSCSIVSKCMFASILVRVCATACSLPFLFKCVQECSHLHYLHFQWPPLTLTPGSSPMSSLDWRL